MTQQRTLVLYHANCPDGFGGAYAAWKKFGNSAEYLPLAYGAAVPSNLIGAHLYFIDFCYTKDVMDSIVSKAASVTVLDHHLSMQDTVETMPTHIFDKHRSGATIAWSFFHPETPVPTLLSYIEDGDLHRYVLSDARAVLLCIYTLPRLFEHWDAFAEKLAQESGYAEICARGYTYVTYHDHIATQLADAAVLVFFEGHDCYLADAPRMFATDVAKCLLARKPTLALLIHAEESGISVSLRSTGVIDAGAVARKYGRNGHPHSAAFFVPYEKPLPWTPLTS